MGSSPSRAGGGDQGSASRHLRNVLGAFAVAVSDLLAEDAQARGFSPAEHAAVILAGTLDGLSQDDLQRRLGLSQPGTTRLVDPLRAPRPPLRAPRPPPRAHPPPPSPPGSAAARCAL